MKILADVGPLYIKQLTGIGYFTDELLRQLSKTDDVTGFAFNFRGKKQVNLPYKVIEQSMVPGKALTYPRYFNLDLPLSLFGFKKDVDAVLGLNFLLPPTGKVPSFPFIHDLCFVDYPQWVQSRNAMILKKMLPKTLKRAAGAIVISEFTKDRLVSIYKFNKPILVVGIPPKLSKVSAIIPTALGFENKKFFLFVSTIEPRKNISNLLDAYEMLPQEVQTEHQLVLAGKPGWDQTVLDRLNSKDNPNIHYLDYVSEAERNWLYKNCICTVIPSHYEGFGMTILESLAAGSPVLASDIPPHREILVSSELCFKPLDSARLKNLLIKFTNPGEVKKAFELQKAVLANYSWPETAKKVTDFIEKVVSK